MTQKGLSVIRLYIRLRYETKLTEKYRSDEVNVLLLNDCNAISECLFISDHIVEMSPVQVPAILL